jgi:hypothetical protein
MRINFISISTLISLFFFSSSFGQKTGLNGRVVDQDSKPVQGAQAKLIIAKKSQTTDSNGNFLIELPLTHVLQTDQVINTISLYNGFLSFSVSEDRQNLRIDVFDNKGQRVGNKVQKVIGKGTYRTHIFPEHLPIAMYFLKLQIGTMSGVFKLMNFKNRTTSLPDQGVSFEKSLLKQSSGATKVIDTLEVSKTGYQTARIDIRTYSSEFPNIVLKSTAKELPPVVNGKKAKTTRYWDCCKPTCGWRSNMRVCDMSGKDLNDPNAQSGCTGGPAFQCWNYAPIEINDKVSYAWAAFNNGGTQCGDCFQLALQGALSGKQMIVQIINTGDGGTDAFDLLIPGGGVGAMNGCSRQWNNAPLGQQYGGFHSTCGNNKDCVRNMCQKAFGDKADLMRGCDWYLNWFQMTSNPEVLYMKVSCPQEIKNISHIGN